MMVEFSSYSNPKTVEAFEAYNSKYWFFKQTNTVLTSLIPLEECDVCVDIGCGTGVGIAGLLEKTKLCSRIIGIDSSTCMLEAARKQHEGNSKVHLIEGKAEHLAAYLDGASVDLVMCNSAFWQMDTSVVLQQVSRVLKNRGIFAFNLVEECLPGVRRLGTKGLFFQELSQWIRGELDITVEPPWQSYTQYYLPIISKEMSNMGLEVLDIKMFKLYRQPHELLSFLSMPRQSHRLVPSLPREIRTEVLRDGIVEILKRKSLLTLFEFVTCFVVQKVN